MSSPSSLPSLWSPLLATVFWASAAALVWVYLGYPLLVALLARGRPLRLRLRDRLPTVSVGIAVHDEAEVIGERIVDVFGQEADGSIRLEEVIVASDGSTDGTEAVVARLAAAEPRLRLLALERGGTTAAQHAILESARSEVVVLTDAETRFARGCLRALAEVFRDPRVGCATGRLEWQNVDATATARNEGLYWRYERLVRGLESRTGMLTAATGAILAVRRSAYRPVGSTTGMDHLLPLYVLEAGGLVVYVPEALATDRPISGLREQYRNRLRTATRGIAANLSMVGRLAPWRRPRAAVAIWSHKLLRWATPWFVAALTGSGLLLALGGEPLYGLAPVGLGVGLVAAATAHLISGTGRRPPRLLAFVRSFLVVNLAFAQAWWNVVLGRRIEAWHRAEFEVRPSGRRGRG
jgi:cellulose synthase/poly-beta-1,6-N-acetylglucosamine synthase-like glycosyltransferase